MPYNSAVTHFAVVPPTFSTSRKKDAVSSGSSTFGSRENSFITIASFGLTFPTLPTQPLAMTMAASNKYHTFMIIILLGGLNIYLRVLARSIFARMQRIINDLKVVVLDCIHCNN